MESKGADLYKLASPTAEKRMEIMQDMRGMSLEQLKELQQYQLRIIQNLPR